MVSVIFAGVISSLLPSYFASKSKNSFSVVISVIGKTVVTPLDLKTPMVNSLPLINSSTNTCVSSLNAFSKAGANSAVVFTLLIPKLLPPLFGFTNSGRVT